jgi:uncharacterized membrane protein
MFFKRLFKVFVFVLAILTANICANYLDAYLSGYRNHYDPVLFTALGMGIIVLIFYPLFLFLDDLVENAAESFLLLGKRLIGRKLGMIAAFCAAFYGLYYLYARMWFGININPRVWAEIQQLVQ